MTTISPMLQSMLNGGVQSAPAANTPYPQQPATPMTQAPDTFTPSTNAGMFAPNPLEGQTIQAPPQGTEVAPDVAAKPKKGWKKIALIGAAIAAVAVAIYSLVRKPGKTSGTAEIMQTTMDVFKQKGGTFQKGVATLSDGFPFSGIISGTNKKGTDYALKYVNGLVEKCTTGADESLITKTFTRDGAGKVVSIVREAGDQVTTFIRDAAGKLVKQAAEATT